MYRFKRFEIIDMVEKGWMKGYLTDLGRSFFQDLVSVKVCMCVFIENAASTVAIVLMG